MEIGTYFSNRLGYINITTHDGKLLRIGLREDAIIRDKHDVVFIDQIVSAIDSGSSFDSSRLDLIGTDFQKLVWDQIRFIPYGTTVTYKELAKLIGMPDSYRAVANACGLNPIPVLIPCHRVVRTDGGMGGFVWGEDMKRTLLRQEGVFISG